MLISLAGWFWTLQAHSNKHHYSAPPRLPWTAFSACLSLLICSHKFVHTAKTQLLSLSYKVPWFTHRETTSEKQPPWTPSSLLPQSWSPVAACLGCDLGPWADPQHHALFWFTGSQLLFQEQQPTYRHQRKSQATFTQLRCTSHTNTLQCMHKRHMLSKLWKLNNSLYSTFWILQK